MTDTNQALTNMKNAWKWPAPKGPAHLAPKRRTDKQIEADIDAAILDALIEVVGDGIYMDLVEDATRSMTEHLSEAQRDRVLKLYFG